MTDTITATVIPAQAGIQTIGNIPTEWDNTQNYGFVRYTELYDKLDSGLRRNDGVEGFTSCGIRFERCLQLCKSQ